MAFDPFGDHAEEGYLRNIAGVSDPEMVKRLEHRSVISNIKEALGDLQTGKPLTYQDVLKTHETLFKDMYPWAGKDRFAVGREETALTGDPSKRDLGGMITKGPVAFMPSSHTERGVDYALAMGNNPETMRASPGEVMGNLAYAHPFLDGNGRTLMAVHGELAARAGIHVDWSKTNKMEYLVALTNEINIPGSNALDSYLKPFVREGSLSLSERQEVFTGLPGMSKPDERPVLTLVTGPDSASRDAVMRDTKLGSSSELVTDRPGQLAAIGKGTSLTIASALGDEQTNNLIDQAKQAGFEVHVKFAGKSGIDDEMRSALKSLTDVIAKADRVQLFEGEGANIREVVDKSDMSLSLKSPKPWAVDVVITDEARKIEATNDLALKEKHLDRLQKAAREGNEAQQQLIYNAQSFKETLERVKAKDRGLVASEDPGEQQSKSVLRRPSRREEGYGL
ncbi:Fic family protein [Roseibium sp. HPY-6]|uniref:Fic family protein n=1 Tax=Roseibium sp. HPY-6 TaxID=3229852 RepID=UPI00338F4F78